MNVEQFIPENLKQQPLFQKIAEVLDYLFDEKINYKDVTDKYKKFQDSDFEIDSVKEIANEYGYKYIIDVLKLNDEEIRELISFISAIDNFKGSRKGLELVFKFLGIKWDMQEWWEYEYKIPFHENTNQDFETQLETLKTLAIKQLGGYIAELKKYEQNTFVVRSHKNITDFTTIENSLKAESDIFGDEQHISNLGRYQSAEIPNNFKLDLWVNQNRLYGDSIDRIKKFIRSYVYAKLENFNLNYDVVEDEKLRFAILSTYFGGFINKEINGTITE